MSDEQDQKANDPPPVWIAASQLPRYMQPLHLNADMRTTGKSMDCTCGFVGTTRTRKALDELELDHRRYHQWREEQATPAPVAAS